ncbi:MAG: hypothetical protein M3Y07_08880 [Acidobacteriota bacterium]|nr:hypothetical protein [Acidobacteriota bacterium]
MKIRNEQQNAFSAGAIEDFISRMIVHLNECFPEHCEALGDGKTREAVEFGIDRASAHGFIAERDVCKYIDLMFVFGRDFDKDESLRWAESSLRDTDWSDPGGRIDHLYDAAMEHARRAGDLRPGDL